MAREELGRTYGLPIFIEIPAGKKAIIGRLLACNYLVTVARSPAPSDSAIDRGTYMLAWSLNADESRRHPDPLMITEAASFTFYNENQNIHFEAQSPVGSIAVSINSRIRNKSPRRSGRAYHGPSYYDN